MTEALEEAANGLDPGGVDRMLEMARDVVALGPGLGQAQRHAGVHQGASSIARRCRS